MKTLPDSDASFEMFFRDLVVRSLDLRDWISEALGEAEEDVTDQLVRPFDVARGAALSLFETFWNQVLQNCFLDRGGKAIPVQRIGYHPRFGWTIEAEGLRAYLGKPSLLENVSVQIGSYSYLSGGSLIRGANRLQIGAYTSIAENFYVNTFRDFHPMDYPSSYNFLENRRLRENDMSIDIEYDFLASGAGPVVIGSDVWIGRNVRVYHGSRIGHGCIVAENSLVRGDLEAYGVYGGSPAKLIRHRFSKATMEALLSLQWWEWPHDVVRCNKRFFSTNLRVFDGNPQELIDAWPAGAAL
jgi:virginiamycin A acetyltransferase